MADQMFWRSSQGAGIEEDMEGGEIADISHHRHHRRWCTFFKQVYFLHRERKILAILPQIYALISVLSTGLNNAVTYQK